MKVERIEIEDDGNIIKLMSILDSKIYFIISRSMYYVILNDVAKSNRTLASMIASYDVD